MTATTVLRRTTPTGRLVLPATAGRDEWLTERRKHIGSSDAPKILGLYGTSLRVWEEKRGTEFPDEDNDAMLFGRLFEEPIAQEWARRNRSVVRRVGLVENIDEPHLACTLDRRVVECPLNRDHREQCALEVKCRNAFGSGNWGNSGLPDDVLAQVLHQIHVTGYSHIHVAVVIGGNDYRQRTVWADRERQTLDFVVGEERRFWNDHVLTGVPPAHNGTGDNLIDLYADRHPNRGGAVQLGVDEFFEAKELLGEYVTAHVEMTAAEQRKKTAQGRMLALLGDSEVAIADDKPLFSYAESNGRPQVDLDQLAERFPDAYAACVKPTKQRRFDAGLRRLAKNKKGSS